MYYVHFIYRHLDKIRNDFRKEKIISGNKVISKFFFIGGTPHLEFCESNLSCLKSSAIEEGGNFWVPREACLISFDCFHTLLSIFCFLLFMMFLCIVLHKRTVKLRNS